MSIIKAVPVRVLALAALMAAAVLATAPAARAADDTDVKGFITLRTDTGFAIQTEKDAPVLVTLGESTRIFHPDGSKMPAADLIPGLRVKVSGVYDGGRLIAREIKFTQEDYRAALGVKSALTATQQQVAENTADIQKGAAVLRQHEQTLDTHGQTLTSHKQEIVANDMKMVATTGALGTRINNLDDFNVIDTFIVYFKNGQAAIQPQFATQLQEFATKARGVEGYKVQVQGYASAVGPRAFNEVLSAQRADAVTAMLVQKGGIAPANVFVPAAMGISEQFAENNTAAGQAENRRVIVTILQNKGIAER